MKRKFIAKAIKHPGALTKLAKKSHEAPMEYAREHVHSKGRKGKEARFALLLRKFH